MIGSGGGENESTAFWEKSFILGQIPGNNPSKRQVSCKISHKIVACSFEYGDKFVECAVDGKTEIC